MGGANRDAVIAVHVKHSLKSHAFDADLAQAPREKGRSYCMLRWLVVHSIVI